MNAEPSRGLAGHKRSILASWSSAPFRLRSFKQFLVRTVWLLFTGVLVLATAAQDFTYTNIDGTITITGYTGSGGNVAIPASIDGLPVTTIGGKAFAGHQSLTAVTIPNTVTHIEDGVLTIGGGLGAFNSCSALTNIILGNNVIYIGIGTFTWCTSLTRVSIPDSVITIGDFAFHHCQGLAEANIGQGVTQLGPGLGYAFNGCTKLSRVSIQGSVSKIGNITNVGHYAFSLCASLTNVTLPASVATIGNNAFSFCTNLAGVYFAGNAPTLRWPGTAFYGSSNVTIYYLPGTMGWEETFDGLPTVLWNPQAQTGDGSFGVQQNGFGFNIAGTADIPLVIEGCSDLATRIWVPLHSCALTNGLLYFSDPQWNNFPRRFYRIRSP